MPELNVNIPHFECFVREEFLRNFENGYGLYSPCVVIGATSIPGHALLFTILLQNGAVYGRLPIHAFIHHLKSPPDRGLLSTYQWWDCPSEKISVITYDFLRDCRVEFKRRNDNKTHAGTYMYTFDWWGTALAEQGGKTGWKCAHLIKADTGDYVLMPNNKIAWEENSFADTFDWDKPSDIPPYRAQTTKWTCEGEL